MLSSVSLPDSRAPAISLQFSSGIAKQFPAVADDPPDALADDQPSFLAL
ncbi:MAG: hypothetical protein F2930_08595 [Actinobacteria bacterium]|nr:hypothetical protein [Actinomycetota bacterium]